MTSGSEADPPPGAEGDAPLPWGPHGRRDSSKRVWVLVALVALALVVVRFWERLAAPFRDQPVAAFVALQPEGEAAARDGLHQLAAGTRFRLFAVLQARTPTGGEVWYTEAPALRLGDRQVPAERLRRWPESGRRARVRWWTVEGFSPYLSVAAADDADRFRMVETFHPEWGSGWSIAGLVDPRNVQLDAASPLKPLPFGVQRWQVRVELFADRAAITPSARAASPGGADALADAGALTTVRATLPAPLARLSAVFGLTQIEPAPGAGAELRARLDEWRRRGLSFERSSVLREHVEAAGADPAALAWQAVDLSGAGTPRWRHAEDDPGVAAGDLVQGGGRIVVLFRDEGEPGRLDRADLVFDFFKGAKIRRLDEVFHGSGELRVEWAPLGQPRRAG